MSFDPVILVIGLALLWTPAWVPKKVLSKAAGQRHYSKPTLGGLITYWGNWVDLARGGLGTYLILNEAYQTDPTTGAANREILYLAAFFGVGVLVQTLRPTRHRVAVISPLFYLCGLTLFLPGFQVGILAIIVGWLFAWPLRDPRAQLPVMAIFVAIAGYILKGADLNVALNFILIGSPLVLNFLLRKPVFIVSSDYMRHSGLQNRSRPRNSHVTL